MRIEGFDHTSGAHCGSTSLRDLSDFYGWDFDEPTCFGLASGLGFTFFEIPTDPWRMFVGRPTWLERAFFENLEIPHTDREGDDFETAWAAVRGHLDRGRPVMLFVDIYYLDYYGTDTHFAPHSLLVVGYDEEVEAPDGTTGVAYTADSEFDEVQELPLSSLREAWASKDVVPLENRYLVAEGDPQADATGAARTAIAETARYMLDPADATRSVADWGEAGIAGIRALAANVPDWPDLEDPRWTACFAYQNVERRGTGGGAFRGLYAPFLDRVEAEVGLDGYADRMHHIADGWAEAGEILREASETDEDDALDDLLLRASDRIAALADEEEAFFADVLVDPDER